MEDWKKRLVEEYTQLHDRYEKLRAFNNKREVKGYFEDYITHCTPEEKAAARKECQVTELLKAQQRTMDEYLHLLELRAELEGIDLVTRL
jgi:predicted enzyme involved in methoxymalonyl-ACP biosynthesis